jgi:hypothetical protein
MPLEARPWRDSGRPQHFHRFGRRSTSARHEHDRPIAVQRRELAKQLVERDRARTRDSRLVDLISLPEVDQLGAAVL